MIPRPLAPLLRIAPPGTVPPPPPPPVRPPPPPVEVEPSPVVARPWVGWSLLSGMTRAEWLGQRERERDELRRGRQARGAA